MFIKFNRRIQAHLYIALCLILSGYNHVLSSDYYFRPLSLAMVGSWRADLEFVVSNPSIMPVFLKLSTNETGIMNASVMPRPIALKVYPTSLLLMPGESRAVTLDYTDNPAQSSYEITVEQMPLWFAVPGNSEIPKTMTTTRYKAEVKVRPTGSGRRQYAFSEFATSNSKMRQNR